MSDDEWVAVARAAHAQQEAENLRVEHHPCKVPGCAALTSKTENGVVKLHYPSATAVRPCVASWKSLCAACGLPTLSGVHVLSGAKDC